MNHNVCLLCVMHTREQHLATFMDTIKAAWNQILSKYISTTPRYGDIRKSSGKSSFRLIFCANSTGSKFLKHFFLTSSNIEYYKCAQSTTFKRFSTALMHGTRVRCMLESIFFLFVSFFPSVPLFYVSQYLYVLLWQIAIIEKWKWKILRSW